MINAIERNVKFMFSEKRYTVQSSMTALQSKLLKPYHAVQQCCSDSRIYSTILQEYIHLNSMVLF